MVIIIMLQCKHYITNNKVWRCILVVQGICGYVRGIAFRRTETGCPACRSYKLRQTIFVKPHLNPLRRREGFDVCAVVQVLFSLLNATT